MSEHNFECRVTVDELYENTEEEVKFKEMLRKSEVQSQFSGYYYDGKATLEVAKQLEKITLADDE